jgi:predicted transcriptional regulator
MNTDDSHVSIKVRADVYKAIKELSEKENRTISMVVRRAVGLYLLRESGLIAETQHIAGVPNG